MWSFCLSDLVDAADAALFCPLPRCVPITFAAVCVALNVSEATLRRWKREARDFPEIWISQKERRYVLDDVIEALKRLPLRRKMRARLDEIAPARSDSKRARCETSA